MLPDKKVKCHHTGFAKTCLSFVGKGQCSKWVNVLGKHPQTGADMNQWGCADMWVPYLLIANTNMQRQTAAAVESFRNEMVKVNGGSISLEPNGRLTINHKA